jgi:hypothetical protein
VDVRIKLWRLASVNGRVTDDRGDPVVRAEVVALRWLSTGDSSAPSRVAFARTDDRGVYRLFDLPAGDYLIGAGRKDLPTIGDIVALSAPTTRSSRRARRSRSHRCCATRRTQRSAFSRHASTRARRRIETR